MDENTEPVIAPRTEWMAAMEIAIRTDTSLAEKIAGVHTQVADFETQPFLAMRTKLMLAVQGGLERETVEKLTSAGKSEDTDIEIELTAAECVYLDMAVRVADFKGALAFKKKIWRAIAAILERKP